MGAQPHISEDKIQGIFFHVTGPLCGEWTGQRSTNTELLVFICCELKRVKEIEDWQLKFYLVVCMVSMWKQVAGSRSGKGQLLYL